MQDAFEGSEFAAYRADLSDEQTDAVRKVLRTGRVNSRVLLRLLHEVLLANVRPARIGFTRREDGAAAGDAGNEDENVDENVQQAAYPYALCFLQHVFANIVDTIFLNVVTVPFLKKTEKI